MKTRGVIYQLSSFSHAEPLKASLYSLRKHYRGPVTVFAVRKLFSELKRCSRRFRAGLRSIPAPECLLGVNVCDSRHVHCLQKACTNLLSPYDRTVFLDADTIVLAPIDSLFSHELGFVGDWHNGRHLRLCDGAVKAALHRKRIRIIRRTMPALSRLALDAMDANPYCVNTGVYVFSPSHPLIREWAILSVACIPCDVDDETTLLMAMPHHQSDITLLDGAWNVQPRINTACNGAFIRHFAGGKWKHSKVWKASHWRMTRCIEMYNRDRKLARLSNAESICHHYNAQ